jgi:hypothetical protein
MADASDDARGDLGICREIPMADVKLRIVGECIIEVGERQLSPDAPHLFALLLYLAIERGRAVQRSELSELLFRADASSVQRTHNLRQLLYRLRGLGVPVEASGTAVKLNSTVAENPLNHFEALGRDRRSKLSAHQLVILPSYDPCVSRQLRDWLDTTRASAAGHVRTILLSDFSAARRECEWDAALRIGSLLQQVDSGSAEVISGVAEALLMVGRKFDALGVIDAFLADHTREFATAHVLRKLRARIDKAKPTSEFPQATFRGRQDALSSLRAAWTQASSGQSQVCVVLGAPGIGKTRLASEFDAFVALSGGQVLTYRCDESDAIRPLSVFAHLVPQLRTLRGSLGSSPDLQHYLDLISEAKEQSTVLEPASIEATRADIVLALVDLVDAVTAEQPVLIIIDDAHQLDPTSCAILGVLGGKQATRPLMVLCCCRGGNADRLPLLSCAHVAVHRLAPLSASESRSLLAELLLLHQRDSRHAENYLSQACGNPFYLHALARHGMEDTSLPFDIRNLASSSYFTLDAHARTVLEASLFLGRFGTLRRVREVAQMDGGSLLAALRAVENAGLITVVDGELRLTHALLEEAIVSLIPSSVAAALHERVARCLQADYEGEASTLPLAWTAAENWMAAGDNGAAMKLLRLCAMQSAGLGEPGSAARTLLRLPRYGLPRADQLALLTDVCEYAEAAGDYELLNSSLRELLALQHSQMSGRAAIQELEFRLVDADLQNGGLPARALERLSALLADPLAATRLRIRAGTRLLISADLQLDQDLAARANRLLQPLLEELPPSDRLRQRAELVYHTAFGDRAYVTQLAVDILALNPRPSLSTAILHARKNAAFTLSRLTRDVMAREALVQDYSYMLAHHVTTEALYRSIVLAETALADGDVAEVGIWLERARGIIAIKPCSPAIAGYLSTVACLAITHGRYDEAESSLDEARRHYPAIASPRWGAIELAFRVRIRLARGESVDASPDVETLHRLYTCGGHLGTQDYIVDALWHAANARGDPTSATKLLTEYLFERRRELATPEWPFRASTASDPAWTRYAGVQVLRAETNSRRPLV